uniref:Ig-like domain-containing protein n=1 Tax=Ditylenchus dipsaci TaxID=166011 RepID=A0A915E786_9BILA
MFDTEASTSAETQATTSLPGCPMSRRTTVSESRRRSSKPSNFLPKSSFAKLMQLPACLVLCSLVMLVAQAQEELAMPHNNPFLAEPEPNPYYVGQNQPGPTIKCAIAGEYRNRSRYELEWLRVVKGNPTTISKNSLLFKKDYDLLESSRDGEYNLRIRSVSLVRDNGNFFCRLIDLVDGHQKQSRPAEVVVVESETSVCEKPLQGQQHRKQDGCAGQKYSSTATRIMQQIST